MELRALQQRLGLTTIMVTHDDDEALTMADQVVVMRAGRLEQVGSPGDVYTRPASLSSLASSAPRISTLAASSAAVRRRGSSHKAISCCGFPTPRLWGWRTVPRQRSPSVPKRSSCRRPAATGRTCPARLK